MTTYLSQILGKPVWDEQGQRLGRLSDVLVSDMATGFPGLRALALRNGKQPHLISAQAIAWLTPSIILNTSQPPSYEERGDEWWLARQILDRQIVDTEGRRLVRVNDIQLNRVSSNGVRHVLAGVDVGTSGLLRRLGIEGLAARLLRILGRETQEVVIPWSDVAPLEADEPIRLRVSLEKIGGLHPADIADIIEDLDRPTGEALLQTLDTETIADTMQEIEPELQASILGTLSPEKAADVLEEMGPDDAADLLADLDPSQRDELLDLMEDEDRIDVKKLLTYPEDTAGGIMTTEFATIPMGLTVEQAVNHLRRSEAAQEDESLYYVYVVNKARELQGVVTVRDLVLAAPDTSVDEIMEADAITVEPLVAQRDVARIVAKYNLLAVPVVDAEKTMQGIVTVDDAIDAIIPTAWKKRLPRIF